MNYIVRNADLKHDSIRHFSLKYHILIYMLEIREKEINVPFLIARRLLSNKRPPWSYQNKIRAPCAKSNYRLRLIDDFATNSRTHKSSAITSEGIRLLLLLVGPCFRSRPTLRKVLISAGKTF